MQKGTNFYCGKCEADFWTSEEDASISSCPRCITQSTTLAKNKKAKKTLRETCRNKVTVNLSVGYQPESIAALRYRFLTGTQESGDNLAIVHWCRA